jgi:hypothetical protein
VNLIREFILCASIRNTEEISVLSFIAQKESLCYYSWRRVDLSTFFFLNCFWWNRSPYYLYFPLPPLRGQPTAKCHPRWQPISGQQSTVGWGDCWIAGEIAGRLGRLLEAGEIAGCWGDCWKAGEIAGRLGRLLDLSTIIHGVQEISVLSS